MYIRSNKDNKSITQGHNWIKGETSVSIVTHVHDVCICPFNSIGIVSQNNLRSTRGMFRCYVVCYPLISLAYKEGTCH